jgi:hypothetical protein
VLKLLMVITGPIAVAGIGVVGYLLCVPIVAVVGAVTTATSPIYRQRDRGGDK